MHIHVENPDCTSGKPIMVAIVSIGTKGGVDTLPAVERREAVWARGNRID